MSLMKQNHFTGPKNHQRADSPSSKINDLGELSKKIDDSGAEKSEKKARNTNGKQFGNDIEKLLWWRLFWVMFGLGMIDAAVMLFLLYRS